MPEGMESTTSLLELANSAIANATTLRNFALGKPAYTTGPGDAETDALEPGSEKTAPPKMVTDAVAALSQVIADIGAITAGPESYLKDFVFPYLDVAALAVVLEFDVARHVPAARGSSIGVDELARAVGMLPQRLARVLRLLFLKRIFREPEPGRVAHTDVSLRLARDPDLAAFLRHCTHDVFPAAAHLADALRQHPDSEEPSQAAFNVAFRTEDPFFAWMQQRPERFANFNAGMRGVSRGVDSSEQQVVELFPWDTLGEATVVDIGGGNGHISLALAEAFPKLTFVVQDLRGAVEAGRGALPEHLRHRVAFQEHDMFEPQPVGGAEVYFLRRVLHDWPDHYASRIVKQLTPGMRHGARLLIADYVVPPPSSLDGVFEKLIRHVDMQMMVLHNARERTEEDWAEVLRNADPRLEVVKVWKTGEGVGAGTLLEARFIDAED